MTTHEREDYYEPPEIVCRVIDMDTEWRMTLRPKGSDGAGELIVPIGHLPNGVAVGDEVTLSFERDVDTSRYTRDPGSQPTESSGSGDTVEYP